MLQKDLSFKEEVESIVKEIPIAKVMTYGQIAALCGRARASRIVGGIAHYGDQSLPWHRVVNKIGAMASGFPGGRISQKKLLEAEGVIVSEDYYLEVAKYLWQPGK